MKRLAFLALVLAFAACKQTPATTTTSNVVPPSSAALQVAPDVAQRSAQLPRTVIDYDRSLLNDNERQVVAKLIDASKQIDEIFWRQVSEENPKWREGLGEHGRG